MIFGADIKPQKNCCPVIDPGLSTTKSCSTTVSHRPTKINRNGWTPCFISAENFRLKSFRQYTEYDINKEKIRAPDWFKRRAVSIADVHVSFLDDIDQVKSAEYT